MESRPPKAVSARLRKLRGRSAKGEPLRASLALPPGFESFWAKTRTELAKVPFDVSRESFRTKHPALFFERLTFGSLGGVRISGYTLWWKDDFERPLAVHGHGYGGGLDIM